MTTSISVYPDDTYRVIHRQIPCGQAIPPDACVESSQRGGASGGAILAHPNRMSSHPPLHGRTHKFQASTPIPTYGHARRRLVGLPTPDRSSRNLIRFGPPQAYIHHCSQNWKSFVTCSTQQSCVLSLDKLFQRENFWVSWSSSGSDP